jgi:hypothetical protein
MKRVLVALAALLLTPSAWSLDAATPKPKDVDIVICLDVSNSMDGLIVSAKNKLWDIINETAKIKPTPNLRVALYSYGNDSYDAKNGWVRKELDLTTDLDALYQKLFALTTNGGTEYATRVARDAINDLKWSDGEDALKIIFVCGNEPADQDAVVSLKAAGDLAKSKNIFINTVYCGAASSGESTSWKQLAEFAGGKFVAIDQNRNVVAVTNTPFDKELAELTGKISETFLAFGQRGEEKQRAQFEQNFNSQKQGLATSAARAYNLANGLYQAQDWCVIDRSMKDAKFDVNSLKVEEMPEALKKLAPEQRTAYVKELVQKREAIQKQILELNKKREEYIRTEQKKSPNPDANAFDEAIRGTIRTQAEARGLSIPKD